MFKRVRIFTKHKTKAKAKEHANFVSSQNSSKVLATGFEHTDIHGHRSWFEIMEWVDKEIDGDSILQE